MIVGYLAAVMRTYGGQGNKLVTPGICNDNIINDNSISSRIQKCVILGIQIDNDVIPITVTVRINIIIIILAARDNSNWNYNSSACLHGS